MFDNGAFRQYSRIIELDPGARKIVWTYEADPRAGFYSFKMGGAQRLENGNTLITESDNGRAFEVTREGEIVWDYYNTDVSKDGTSRNKIWRIHRVSAKELGALHWSDEARRSFAEAEFPLPQ